MLLDCTRRASWDDVLYCQAALSGATALLFGASKTVTKAKGIAAQQGVSAFVFPIEDRALNRLLSGTLTQIRPCCWTGVGERVWAPMGVMPQAVDAALHPRAGLSMPVGGDCRRA